MDAPLCKLCQSRHYGQCAGVLIQSTPEETEGKKDQFDRKEYQRNYMRERRKSQIPVNAIYAIVQYNEPEIVKIGQTKRWDERKTHFSSAESYTVYFINASVDLMMIEQCCLKSMKTPPYRANEWFKASIEDARICIELILNTLKLPYTVLHGSTPAKPTRNATFDRQAYQREYMREYRRTHKYVPK